MSMYVTDKELQNVYDCIMAIKMAIKALKQESKTGHWINVNNGNTSYTVDGMTNASVKCSECDEWLTASDEYACYGNYCPNCGAKMENESEEFDNLEEMLEKLWNAK